MENIKEKAILEDTELDELIEILEENRDESLDLIAKLPSNSGEEMSAEQKADLDEKLNLDIEETKQDVTMSIDPKSGMAAILGGAESAGNEFSLDDILEDKDVTFDKEAYSEALKNNGITVDGNQEMEDMIEVLSLMYSGGNTDNIFSKLPKTVQDQISSTIPKESQTPAMLDNVAKQFLGFINQELKFDKTFVDFQKAIEKELDIPDYMDMYLDDSKDIMEVQLLEKSKVIEEEHPKKAAQLREVSKYFTYSYDHTLLRKKISNKSNVNRDLTNDLKKFNKFCSRFNRKYHDSKYSIIDIKNIAPILERKLESPEDIIITSDDIKKFILLFIKSSNKMEPTASNIQYHTYMYYFVKNISMLDHIESIKGEFSKEILSNIVETIRLIKNN